MISFGALAELAGRVRVRASRCSDFGCLWFNSQLEVELTGLSFDTPHSLSRCPAAAGRRTRPRQTPGHHREISRGRASSPRKLRRSWHENRAPPAHEMNRLCARLCARYFTFTAGACAAGSLLQYGITPAERASEEWLRMVVSYHGVRSLWNTEGPVKDTTMVRLVGYYHAILREK